mmetsp:Transcript_41475/g.81329  ORF Transcript_41475/g.81329 Transcript_41475/m.81329 type:complete len:204 (+) Transcript_41475:319-930(+)
MRLLPNILQLFQIVSRQQRTVVASVSAPAHKGFGQLHVGEGFLCAGHLICDVALLADLVFGLTLLLFQSLCAFVKPVFLQVQSNACHLFRVVHKPINRKNIQQTVNLHTLVNHSLLQRRCVREAAAEQVRPVQLKLLYCVHRSLDNLGIRPLAVFRDVQLGCPHGGTEHKIHHHFQTGDEVVPVVWLLVAEGPVLCEVFGGVA